MRRGMEKRLKEENLYKYFQNGADRGGGESPGGLSLLGGNPGEVRHQHPHGHRHRRALLPAPGKNITSFTSTTVKLRLRFT